MATEAIRITGARQNNLKDLDLELPLGELIVVTGRFIPKASAVTLRRSLRTPGSFWTEWTSPRRIASKAFRRQSLSIKPTPFAHRAPPLAR